MMEEEGKTYESSKEREKTKEYVKELQNLDFNNIRDVLQWFMDFSNKATCFDKEIIDEVILIFEKNGYSKDDINLKNRGKGGRAKFIIIQQLKFMADNGYPHGNFVSFGFDKWKARYGKANERVNAIKKKIVSFLKY